MSPRIPDWVLERYVVGELPEGFHEEDIARDPSVPERLAALRQSNAEILERLAPPAVAREIRRRSERPSAREAKLSFRLPRWTPALVAACLVAVLVPTLMQRGGEGEGDGVRSKGLTPHLEVYRQTGPETEVLTPGASARAGDVLQLKVLGGSERFAAVVSLDGAGAVTLHAPEHEGAALALPTTGIQALAHAYALDAAPGFERFVLVTSEEPFDVAVVLTAARALGANAEAPLVLPRGLRQSSFVVRKEEVP